MFTRFYARRAEAAAAPVYVARDSVTRHVIATGSREAVTAFQNAFGACYIERA